MLLQHRKNPAKRDQAMQDTQKRTYSAVNHPSTTVKDDERRGGNRHLFTAAAEVIELGSGARFSTRTTDLGPGGCFVDTLVPFPVGSRVRISVRKAKREFQTEGVVVYSQQGLGMGIAFDDLNAGQRDELGSWISELTGTRFSAAESVPVRVEERPQQHGQDSRAAFVRLVQLLVSKRLITEAEAASVFFDPIM